MSENNVTPLRGSVASQGFRQHMVESLGKSINDFEQNGAQATAALWVIVDDKGEFRIGWDSRHSNLPASALVGISLGAMLQIRNDHTCG